MAYTSAGSDRRATRTTRPAGSVCVLCEADATHHSASPAGTYSAPDAAGKRHWQPYPDIDLCDGCLTLVIFDRIEAGWCPVGQHWGLAYTDCRVHRDYFDKPATIQ